MKPSWDDAPAWARYLAMNKDGTWVWYEDKPELGFNGTWHSDTEDLGKAQVAFSWDTSLEEKPSVSAADELDRQEAPQIRAERRGRTMEKFWDALHKNF